MRLSGEAKLIGGIGLLILAILVGGVFFLTKTENPSVPESEIVERNGLHWHPKLKVTINGKKQEIPAGLGLAGQIHQELHTHDKDGVIHMEMKGIVTKDETKLGNFFRVWGKEFNSTQIFDKKNGEEGKVKMIVNGKENRDYENYLMKDGNIIEIKYE